MPIPAPADLVALWTTNSYRKVLALVSKWATLGDERDAIQKGHQALRSPQFYASIGEDPPALIRAGLDAVSTRYGLTSPDPTAVATLIGDNGIFDV